MKNENETPECPDPNATPDYCDVCEGWGFKCSAFIATHSADRVADGQAAYDAGYDPYRFYTSAAAARLGEMMIAAKRRRS